MAATVVAIPAATMPATINLNLLFIHFLLIELCLRLRYGCPGCGAARDRFCSIEFHAGCGCSLTRLTSCVGLTKRSAISSHASVTIMYTMAMASTDCGARTPAANTA